ncbi:hypothetical protein MAPG_05741 [Magnaporthiopsis poae ATCC 64411]|uniref:Uncharacterized protein n=1 Tax=Magnaporthiopsis poae (strain ATCC 64411 / 73-15) TaxID=644358 RepID=A0A0C4E073_MAGP6|nr:hypothetical protein MAPG_05741 [Magnaporthiopsis poae ATCC 64411]
MADTTTSDAQERWRLVVVPLFVVMTVGLLALGVTMMRRRYGLNNGFGGPHDHHHYRGNGNSRLDPSYYYSRREEGLNELGEAPPPYVGTGEGKKGGEGGAPGPAPAADGSSSVEMSSPPREPPPAAGAAAATAASSLPPAYSEVRRA